MLAINMMYVFVSPNEFTYHKIENEQCDKLFIL